MAELALHAVYAEGGAVQQDAVALLDSVFTAGRCAAREAGVPLSAVALANQGESVLAWDRGSASR